MTQISSCHATEVTHTVRKHHYCTEPLNDSQISLHTQRSHLAVCSLDSGLAGRSDPPTNSVLELSHLPFHQLLSTLLISFSTLISLPKSDNQLRSANPHDAVMSLWGVRESAVGGGRLKTGGKGEKGKGRVRDQDGVISNHG